jgi:hypothetical protein
MARITDYQSLIDNVESWLNRSDLTAQIPTFIQLAESEFKRDMRCRKLQDSGDFSVTADGDTLPDDFLSMESWVHDGPTYYGPIEIVTAAQLPGLKSRYGLTGAPRFAAIADGSTLRYAPEPDSSYTTTLQYWRKIEDLSASETTNWLILSHPDIYLYGVLLQAAPYLEDDARIPVWGSMLEKALDSLSSATTNAQFGGDLRREHRPIGG